MKPRDRRTVREVWAFACVAALVLLFALNVADAGFGAGGMVVWAGGSVGGVVIVGVALAASTWFWRR